MPCVSYLTIARRLVSVATKLKEYSLMSISAPFSSNFALFVSAVELIFFIELRNLWDSMLICWDWEKSGKLGNSLTLNIWRLDFDRPCLMKSKSSWVSRVISSSLRFLTKLSISRPFAVALPSSCVCTSIWDWMAIS